MTDVGNESAVASALLTLTERGSLAWEEFTSEEEELPQSPDVPGDTSLFVTFHRGMDLYLWEADGKSDSGESSDASTRLKVVDPEASAGWTFPVLKEIDDLYELVRFRHASLKDWMQEVVEDANQEWDSSGENDPSNEEESIEPEVDDLSDDQSSKAPSWTEDSEAADSDTTVSPPGGSPDMEAGTEEEDSDPLSGNSSAMDDEESVFDGSQNEASEEGHAL
jgi:hypothetical protein